MIGRMKGGSAAVECGHIRSFLTHMVYIHLNHDQVQVTIAKNEKHSEKSYLQTPLAFQPCKLSLCNTLYICFVCIIVVLVVQSGRQVGEQGREGGGNTEGGKEGDN